MNCVASPHSRGQGRLRSTLFLHSGNGVTTLDWGEFSSGKFGSRIIQHQQPLHLLCSPPAKHPVSQRVFLSDGVFPTPPFVAMALRPIFAPSKWIPIHHLMALRGAEDIGGSFPLSLELGWEHIYFIYTYNCFSLYILFFQTCVDIYMYTDMCVCVPHSEGFDRVFFGQFNKCVQCYQLPRNVNQRLRLKIIMSCSKKDQQKAENARYVGR